MRNPRFRRTTFLVCVAAIIGSALALSTLALVPTVHSADNPTTSSVYTVNGLTCPFPNAISAPDAVLAMKVVQSPSFISMAAGLPYKLFYVDNLTGRTVTTGRVITSPYSPGNTTNGQRTYENVTTTILPDTTELTFTTWGPTTSCTDVVGAGTYLYLIEVQVPIQNGGYNMTGESVHLYGAPSSLLS